MAQLSRILGSVLRDIVSAQHEANLYSLSLSDTYNKDGKARDFQLPNVVVSDMEMDIKYGIKGDSNTQQQFNIEYSKFRVFIKSLCKEISEEIIETSTETIMNSEIIRKPSTKSFFIKLKNSPKVRKDFSSFLSRNILNGLRLNINELIDKADGKVKKGIVEEKVIEIIIDRFILDDDLEELFSGKSGEELKEEVIQNIKQVVSNQIESRIVNQNFKSLNTFPQLDVAITSEELASMPQEAIHSFKLKFSPRNYTLTQIESEYEDYVMK